MPKRRNSLTPQFEFDDATGQFRNLRTGRFVARLAVRAALDDYIDAKGAEMKALAEQLRNREITIGQWQKAIENNIAKIHLANAAAAKGGTHAMQNADFGRVGGLVKYEYQQLREFAKQIENGLPLDGRFMNRIGQYASAGRHTYHEVDRLEQQARGMAEERSILHARDSCAGCLSAAAAGWQPAGTLPLPGERQCLRSCRCSMEYRVGES